MRYLTLFIILFFFSCSKEDDADISTKKTQKNKIKIGEKEFDLDYSNQGDVFDEGDKFKLHFSFSNTNSKGFGKKCSSCNYMYLTFSCYSDNSNLEKKTFEIINDYFKVKSSNYCYVSIDNVSLAGKNEEITMANGNLEIKKLSKKEIEFAFFGESLDGIKISGQYNGEFNDSDL